MADRDRREIAVQVELEALDSRDEAAECDNCRRPWATPAEAQRVGHHRSLREAAEDDPFRRDSGLGRGFVQPAAGLLDRGGERRRIGIPDAADHVPVRSARGQRKRGARREAEEAASRIDEIEHRDEIELVRTAAVQKDERADGSGRGQTRAVLEDHAGLCVRTSGSGVSTGSS